MKQNLFALATGLALSVALLAGCAQTVETPPTPTDTSTDGVVRVAYAGEDLLAQPDSYSKFVADTSEYQVDLLFSADAPVTQVRILSLTIVDASEDGVITYDSEELYALETLTPEKPLVVTTSFWGDIPNLGISYVDNSGKEHVYDVGVSGENGGLLMTEAALTK